MTKLLLFFLLTFLVQSSFAQRAEELNIQSKALLNQIESIVKLIRSKGIGLYFVTQNPTDVPESVLSQLGLKVQHALRAFTAKDRKAIKLAAQNYPDTDFYDTASVLTSLGIGEALVSALDEKGRPTPLAATMMRAPMSRMDILTPTEINTLLRKSELVEKYNDSIDRESAYENLLKAGDEASSRLEDLQGGDSKLAQLQNESLVCFDELKDLGLKLSTLRASVAKKLSVAITSEMALLAMPNAKLSVQVTTSDGSEPENFSATGIDEVLFLFTSHTDGKLLPLAKAASGGELSRVMLSIEVVLAKNSPVGTYIFDEVDAGVGGKAAIEVGKRLALLAQNSQVIVVTHLAQVASWADNHFVVSKNESGSVTQSNILEVSGADRRKEIARLLSGQEDSKTAQEHAGELLDMVAMSRSEMIG